VPQLDDKAAGRRDLYELIGALTDAQAKLLNLHQSLGRATTLIRNMLQKEETDGGT
jgi:hypothetical protein